MSLLREIMTVVANNLVPDVQTDEGPFQPREDHKDLYNFLTSGEGVQSKLAAPALDK